MTFAAPWGLLALLAVPAVVCLHLFRSRLPERRVAGLFLFAGERLVVDGGRKRTPLVNSPSLWLECILAAVFALWLAGLSFGGAPVRHVVFVLDDSASMGAGETRRTVLDLVQQRLSTLGAGDLITVLRTGPRPQMLCGPRALVLDVGPALMRWRPSQRRHDLGPALDLARELATPGDAFVFSDEKPPVASDGLHWVAVGDAVANCALLAADRVPRADGGEVVRVRVAAFGDVPPTELTIRGDGLDPVRHRLQFADGVAEVEAALPATARDVALELSDDALLIDNTAWLLPKAPRIVSVCDLLPAALRDALQWPRVAAALPDCRVVSEPRSAQLLLTSRPGAVFAGQVEVVIDPGDGERRASRGPFVIDRAHAFLSGIELQGVTWFFGRRELPGHVLIAAGAQVLASEQLLARGRRLWLDVDARAGNLVRSPDWPILFANLVEACRREAPGAEEPHVLLGDEARFRRVLPAEDARAALSWMGPDGSRHELLGGAVLAFVPDEPGIYRVLDRHGSELQRFAARFVDPGESDLRSRCRVEHPAAAGAEAERFHAVHDTSLERRVLMMLAFVLLLANWLSIARRAT